jgi:hypothetical protein
MNKAYIGYGYDELEVVSSPFEIYDQVNLWIFPDTYQGPFIEWLRDKGEIVWGAGQEQELEIERDILKKHMEKLELPVNQWKKIIGLDKLREFLFDNDNVYVKINKWRGSCESFFSKNYRLIEPELNELEYRLGPLAQLLEFVVEQPIDPAVEVGYDGYCVDGKYPEEWISGPEIKDKAYVGKVIPYKNLSPLITNYNEAMASTFKNYGYRNFLSTEVRIDESQTPYMIDATHRMPCPPGSIYLELIENLGEIIWSGANGEITKGKFKAQYGVELLMESEWAIHNFQAIYYPKEYESNIKLKKACCIDNTYYIIPQSYGSSDIGSIVTINNDLQKAIDEIKVIADTIEGNGITIRKDCLDTAIEEFTKFEQFNEHK